MLAGGEDRDLRLAGARARQARVWLARQDVNAFVELVMRDRRGRPIVQAPMHAAWHRLADRHPRLIILAHVEGGKTSQMAARILWRLGRDPRRTFGVLGNTVGQAIKTVKEIRRLIESSEELREVFPHLRPSAHKWTDSVLEVERQVISRTPSVQALGIGGSFLGDRIDEILADDLLDFENTRTELERQKLWEWWHATPVGRLTGDGRVVIIGNAFHPRDLLHRLAREEPAWVLRRFPVVTPSGNPSWAAWTHERIEAKRVELGPLEAARQLDCRAFDEATARFRPEWFEAAKRRGEGRSFVTSLPAVPEGCGVFVGVDLAVQDRRSADWTAFVVILVRPNGDRELLHCEKARLKGPEIVDRIVDMHRRYHGIVMVESNAAQAYILQFVRDRSAVPVQAFVTGRNKADPSFGVESIATEFAAGKWVIPSRGGRAPVAAEELIQSMLFYAPPPAHTPDDLMALWFAREAARRWWSRRERSAGARPAGRRAS